ncbi:LysE family translocator [Pseudomonas sp. NBRC 111137]|uniref:LysE family translocator n=1 Tax=Pseudomonas sp. NBRC 111137 TaxID=1661052 RepID=UPI0009E85A60|nr:LysE family translocator [Pseudomonas sp. NBRC 111137]
MLYGALGNIFGLFLLSLAAMLGVGLLLKANSRIFTALKTVGTVYLFYLGVQQFISRKKLFGSESSTSNPARSFTSLFKEPFLLSISNPKPILFFTALFPQFITPGVSLPLQFLVLTGIFMFLSLMTLQGYGLASRRMINLLRQPKIATRTSQVVGLCFIGFGVLLLTY